MQAKSDEVIAKNEESALLMHSLCKRRWIIRQPEQDKNKIIEDIVLFAKFCTKLTGKYPKKLQKISKEGYARIHEYQEGLPTVRYEDWDWFLVNMCEGLSFEYSHKLNKNADDTLETLFNWYDVTLGRFFVRPILSVCKLIRNNIW